VASKKRGKPEEAADRAVRRITEATRALVGDKTAEVEGRAERTKARRKTYVVVGNPGGGGKVETEGAERRRSRNP
jgi:hypothetical protein